MDRLDMMRAFAEVARQGGFAPAARKLDMSSSALSRHIASLEEWLGVQLFHRTTRHVNLTDAGQGYLVRCLKVLEEVRDIEQAGQDSNAELSGTVRMSAPSFLGRQCIVPLLSQFLKDHPGIHVDLFLGDRLVDLVGEGFDLAVRITKPLDSTLIARRLGTTRLCVVGSPAYFETNGCPRTIRDLQQHNCIVDRAPELRDRWEFRVGGKKLSQRVGGQIQVNDGEAARKFSVEGIGLARLPGFFVDDALASGELIEVALEDDPEEIGFYALYPPSRHLARSIRSLIDWLAAEVGN